MSNFLVDFGDEVFANQICSDLIKRGIEWSTLDENPKAQTAKSNRTLIVSSRTSNCDVMSSGNQTTTINNNNTHIHS